MRVVVDTNVVVSGLVWGGAPRRVLELGERGVLSLFTSIALLDELRTVLNREKFAPNLERIRYTAAALALRYASLTTVIETSDIPLTVTADPDDDRVVACAVASDADLVVSGDHHLLELGRAFGIEICRVEELLSRIAG